LSRGLLDVNVLIALLDASHQFHDHARSWLEANIHQGWASSPVTENGAVRILSLPAYPNVIPPLAAIHRLRAATQTPHHEFWSDEVSLLDPAVIRPERVHGPKQVTDLYLLALAVRRGGRFVTFDDHVPLSAVVGAAPESLYVL